jgi:predicted enzyme related to lactoylglutathione lyase
MTTSGVKTVIYPVRDLPAAKALFSGLLGVEPAMDEPYYVGYRVADQDIGLDPAGHSKGMTGPVAYWHVDDIEQAFKALVAGGAKEVQAVNDVGGGKLVAIVNDVDGNHIGLIQE